jgi:hypothetical protein
MCSRLAAISEFDSLAKNTPWPPIDKGCEGERRLAELF